MQEGSPKWHFEKAEALLKRAEGADQSMSGFALSQSLCAQAELHIKLAELGR